MGAANHMPSVKAYIPSTLRSIIPPCVFEPQAPKLPPLAGPDEEY